VWARLTNRESGTASSGILPTPAENDTASRTMSALSPFFVTVSRTWASLGRSGVTRPDDPADELTAVPDVVLDDCGQRPEQQSLPVAIPSKKDVHVRREPPD